MKAAFFKEHGGAERIMEDEYRDPVPEAGEVIVRVRACALYHVDRSCSTIASRRPRACPTSTVAT